MKRRLFIITSFLLLSGCIYKSVIISKSPIRLNVLMDTLTRSAGILSRQVTFDYLRKFSDHDEKGVFDIYLSNDSIIKQATATIVGDSIILNGSIIYKSIKDTSVNFRLRFNKRDFSSTLSPISSENYQLALKHTNSKQDSSKIFTIFKSRNFIITDHVMELLTGEIQYKDDAPYDYVVINDPSTPPNYLLSIGLLHMISEKEIKKFGELCREKKIGNCKKGCEIEAPKFAWTEFQIICKCL